MLNLQKAKYLRCALIHTRARKNPAYKRNFAKRLAKPALNRGRYQIAAERVFSIQPEAITRDVIEFARALHIHQGKPITPGHYRSACAALRRIAVRTGRAKTMGRPWLWRWTRQPNPLILLHACRFGRAPEPPPAPECLAAAKRGPLSFAQKSASRSRRSPTLAHTGPLFLRLAGKPLGLP